LGQTLEGQRIWDVRRAFAVLRNRMELKDVPIWIQGKGNAAVTALYAALYEPDVKRIDLWNPPASHRQGPPLLNVLRVLDLPQALALAAPRPLRLYVEDDKEAKRWEWTRRLEEKLGRDTFKIRQVGEGTDR
jgi:RES domain-containing protein